MTRLRWLFATVALLFAVPLTLLVSHALSNVEAERQARHRALAERLFDEMERELTAWLRQEEDRAYDQYRYLYFPDGLANPQRSPLADGPHVPFVLAHFQIEPDGTVSSPLWPVDADRAAQALGWRMDGFQEERRDEILELLGDLVLRRAPPQEGRADSPREKRPVNEVPGSPTSVNAVGPGQGVGTGGQDAQSRRQEALARLRDRPAADLLSRLNRGQQSRQGRTTKVQQSQVENVLDFTQAPAISTTSEEADRAPGSGLDGAEMPAGQGDLVAVSLEPMVGRNLAGSGVLLYRTVVIADRAYRQGMVIDGPSLVEWLESRVLAPSPRRSSRLSALTTRSVSADARKVGGSGPLDDEASVPGDVEVSWSAGPLVSTTALAASPSAEPQPSPDKVGGQAENPAPAKERIAFSHRFAEPFASVEARVELDPLPALPATRYIHFLAGLLGLVGSLGLLALYRTVAVRLAFAERRNNFVSAVTHELKTPLTAIRMYGEMLRDGVVPNESRRQDYYRILTAEAERLTRLIHNVLELSRLEKHTRRFDLSPGDPRLVLREVVEVLTPHAREHGFELLLEDNGPATATYDRDALAQVLFNLVDNAIKYAVNAEDRTVLLRSRVDEDRVRLTVADRGPGIRRKHLKMVFEPFYRGEDELTRSAKGTGIGLSLVQSLMRQMGGSVRGRNRDGGGFEVTLELPSA